MVTTETAPAWHDAACVAVQEKWQRLVAVEGRSASSPVAFPLVLQPRTATKTAPIGAWIRENRRYLRQCLSNHGAILFRGFQQDLRGAREFEEAVEALGVEPLPYIGGNAPRNVVYGSVYTSNESPPSETIPFHHEMAQVPTNPSTIFFYCDVPALSGGATPLLRSDELLQRLQLKAPSFVANLEQHGVRYTRVLPPEDDPSSAIGRSWKSTYQTEERSVAEDKARALGCSLEWLPDGNVRSQSSRLPAIQSYSDGTKVFFNSMVAAYTGWKDARNDPREAVTFGNGAPLDPSDIELTRALMEEICVAIAWQKGDMLCVDNRLVMHARRTFVPPRRVLAYIGK